MNKIYLIGNGFDLAHGFKTKYSDFLLWFVNKTVKSYHASHSNIYDDDLVTFNSYGYHIKEFDSLNSFKECLSNQRITFTGKNVFFNNLLRQSYDSNWVDIEYEYYRELLAIYKRVEKNNISVIDGAEKMVREINNCFDLIKDQLVEYLQTINTEAHNIQIELRFLDELKNNPYDEVLFLVFNYTNTIESYIKSQKIDNGQVIYIHGQLSKIENPIIFGYGDEMDDYYSKIESLNMNEFLKNFKSFSYFKTNNYLNLSNFLNRNIFKVSIMGHSCGLSDRVLLNSIFCHPNCNNIRIYYHQKNRDENDYVEKTQEISRHFPLDQKSRMRNLIVPFPGSMSLS
jgi:hypothetical protein